MSIFAELILTVGILAGCWYGYKAWIKHSATKHSKIDNSIDDEEEEIEGRPFELSENVAVQAHLLLHYRDAAGFSTKRLVDVREADIGWREGYVYGICHLRNAFRTFRIDRIERCVIPETGEIVENVQAYLRKTYSESPIFSVNKVLNEAYDITRALLYIGRADGRFTKKEKEVLLKFCQSFSNDERIVMSDLDRAIDYYNIPSKQSFRLICGRVAKLPLSSKTQLIEIAAEMIKTERTADPDEIEAINYLGRRLALPVPDFMDK